MNLFKIQNDLVADRSADAWYRIRIAGPTFNYRWTYGWNGDGDFSNILGEHESHAVCREEPSLTMSWGLNSWTQPEPPTYQWADKFVGDVRRSGPTCSGTGRSSTASRCVASAVCTV